MQNALKTFPNKEHKADQEDEFHLQLQVASGDCKVKLYSYIYNKTICVKCSIKEVFINLAKWERNNSNRKKKIGEEFVKQDLLKSWKDIFNKCVYNIKKKKLFYFETNIFWNCMNKKMVCTSQRLIRFYNIQSVLNIWKKIHYFKLWCHKT